MSIYLGVFVRVKRAGWPYSGTISALAKSAMEQVAHMRSKCIAAFTMVTAHSRLSFVHVQCTGWLIPDPCALLCSVEVFAILRYLLGATAA